MKCKKNIEVAIYAIVGIILLAVGASIDTLYEIVTKQEEVKNVLEKPAEPLDKVYVYYRKYGMDKMWCIPKSNMLIYQNQGDPFVMIELNFKGVCPPGGKLIYQDIQD